MPSATIKIFLVEGDAKRLRTAELSNWTGKAIAGPRNELDRILDREEARSPGVYFLTGADPESGKSAIYIGEAETICDRLQGHVDKDFWNHVIFFISKDENITKAHIRYLEGRLIAQAREADRSMVMNSQSSGSKLPESDQADMEIFLEKIHQLLPVLGVHALVPTTSTGEGIPKEEILYCRVKGLEARAHLTPNGLVVHKGSQAVLEERDSAHTWPGGGLNVRQQLQGDGSLTEEGNHLVFTRDVEFASPSAAASVIHGGHVNGRLAWKNAAGKSLKELEADRALGGAS